MKTLFNMTTSSDDMNRFADRAAFLELLQGFDGVELMPLEEDTRGIIPRQSVIGLHMRSFPYWLDLWNGDLNAVRREFGSLEIAEKLYGGLDRNALLNTFRRDLNAAHAWGAEYAVFHVSDATVRETFLLNYRHTDEEVIDAAIELLSELFAEENGSLALLVENLWQPGLTFTRPEMTQRLMEGIRYPNKGIMLDTGHLMHTNLELSTQEEALSFLHEMLDRHGELCQWIRGMHLNQSLTGAHMKQIRNNPPVFGNTYEERASQMFWHAFAIDQHLPFTCEGVDKLIKRISPETLTFEFITTDLAQLRKALNLQREALGRE